MGKSEAVSHRYPNDVMELEDFVRTALQAIIRGMEDAGEDNYSAEGLSRIDFKLSLEAVNDGKIYVTKTEGRASPNSNRIEFSTKIMRNASPVQVVELDESRRPRPVDERGAS